MVWLESAILTHWSLGRHRAVSGSNGRADGSDAPTGKNNGSVNGEAYFVCEPNHGVFVRASQITILATPRSVRDRKAFR